MSKQTKIITKEAETRSFYPFSSASWDAHEPSRTNKTELLIVGELELKIQVHWESENTVPKFEACTKLNTNLTSLGTAQLAAWLAARLARKLDAPKHRDGGRAAENVENAGKDTSYDVRPRGYSVHPRSSFRLYDYFTEVGRNLTRKTT